MTTVNDLFLLLCLETQYDSPSAPPLSLAEWCCFKDTLKAKDIDLSSLLSYGVGDFVSSLDMPISMAERVWHLLHREVGFQFDLEHYRAKGITLLTYEHSDYPSLLKSKLGVCCPPVLCAMGDISLLKEQGMGLLSSRLVDKSDGNFVVSVLPQMLKNGNVLTVGGVRGAVATARDMAVKQGAKVISFMANPLSQTHMSEANALSQSGLVLSLPPYPCRSFEERAVIRNLCVMAMAKATLIVKAEHQRGSTWLSATEALTRMQATVLCHYHPRYQGNLKLIDYGAVPINANWNGRLPQ